MSSVAAFGDGTANTCAVLSTNYTGTTVINSSVPVFVFRHYIQDKGSFPPEMMADLEIQADGKAIRRAGFWPFVVLALGVAVVWYTHHIAVY